MARNKLSNTFLKLDTDTSQNKQDNTSFYDGQNLRLVSDEALTNGALVNFKGTKAKINLGHKSTKLKGYAEIGDDLALLLHRPVTELVPDSPTISIADTTLSNYEVSIPLENTTFSNTEDVELNESIRNEFTGVDNIALGAVVHVVYSSGGSNIFKLLPEFRYKIEFTATGVGTINPSIVIFNFQGIQVHENVIKAKLKLAKSDVLLYREFTGTTTITESISFYVPNTENYYIAFYPNGFTEDATYITNNIIDASVDITINNIWYNKGWDIDYVSPQLKNRFIWNPPVSSTPVDISNNVFPYTPVGGVKPFKVTLRFSELSAKNARIVMVDDSNIEIEPDAIIACNEDDLYPAGFDLLNNDGSGDGYSYSFVNGASVGTTDVTVSAIFLYDNIEEITSGCKFVIEYESTESANITIDEQHVEYINNYGSGAGEVNSSTDVFTLIDSYYKQKHPENIDYIKYSPYTTEFYDILIESYLNIVFNFTGGYKYEIDLTAISDTHGSIKLGIGTSFDAPEKEEYVTSGIAHKLIVDLTQVTGSSYLLLWSHINETIDITVSNIVSISPLDILLYTIPTNDKIIFQFKGLTTIGGTSSYDIKIKDTIDAEVSTYSYLKETSNPTVHDVFFENQLGYKVYLRMCPDALVGTEMLISDVREYLLDNNKTYPLNILQNNKLCKVNISQDSILTHIGTLATPYIIYKVVNTLTQEILYTTQSNILEDIEFSFITPNNTGIYRLYVGFINEFAALSVALTDGIITYYTVSAESAYGNIIAKVTPDNTNARQDITILYSDAYSKDSLAFDSVEQVQVLGLYETNDSKKIYFAVPDKPLRLFNIATNDFSIAEATSLDILPNSVTSSVSITDIVPGGNIPNGKIQYACRLFDKYGAETSFSSASELISLTQSNVGDDSFTGGDIEISSGKSTRVHVQLSIYNNFKYVRLYAIHYSTPDIPEIYLVGEKEITNNFATFIDTGIKLDTITLEEFNAFGGRVFSAEVIEEKNNILFAANIKESQDVIAPEDLDCRAYRFDSTGRCKIWERDDITNPSYYTINSNGDWDFWKYNYTENDYIIVDSGHNWSIPITADAINRYNDEFLKSSGSNVHPYLYDRQSNGNTIGGTGKIVSYEIKTSDGVTVVNDGKLNVTNTNQEFILKSTSLKQGEVYRIGLVPYDLKGKPYFVHWVGDIRMPYVDTLQESIVYKTGTGDVPNITYINKNIYIEVSINKFNIPQNIISKLSGFKLVYVERKDVDKSVIAQGYTNGSMLYSEELAGYGFNTYYTGSDDDSYNVEKVNYHYIHQFISPEFNINNGKIIEEADLRLHVNKIISKINYRYMTSPVDYKRHYIIYPNTKEIQSGVTTNNTLQSVTGKRFVEDPFTFTVSVGTSFDINNVIKTSLKTKNDSGGYIAVANNENITIHNRVISNTLNTARGDKKEATMFGPTGIVFTSDYALLVKNYSTEIGTQKSWIYVLDLYRNNAVTRYGGDTYQARSVNSYISLSEFIPTTEYIITSFGDTYNSVFDILLSGRDFFDDPDIDSNTIQTSGLYPIESSVNCFLTSIKPSTINNSNLNESQTIGIETWGAEYPLIGNTNRYNSVYSVNSKYPLYYPKPLFFDELSTEPYTISHSQKKIRGEYTDSWTKFLYANSLEVSGRYGAIHGLTHYNNKLIFFQEDAVGTVAVNERYLIGKDASQLALGTGGVLERYDYLKYNTGIIKPNHFLNTETELFYIDHNKKVIDILSEGQQVLSFAKGVNALFRHIYKDKNTLVAIGYDPQYKEVLFAINNNVEAKTLVYSTMTGTFVPCHSTTPEIYINLNKELLSFITSNQDSAVNTDSYIYRHNVGDFGETYSEAGFKLVEDAIVKNIKPSYVSFIVNTKDITVCIFDNVEFNTEVRELTSSEYYTGPFADTTCVEETIDTIEFKNSYQALSTPIKVKSNTAVLPNASRRIRGWNMAIPLTTTSNRFVDTFLSVKMNYNNNTNKLFKLHDVITYIRKANK